MKRGGLLIPAVGLLAAFLGWKCYEAWTAPPPSAAPAGSRGAAAANPSPQAEAARAADLSAAVTAIVVRPVFRPDRKPFEESAATASARNYEAELGRFTVVGVLSLEGSRKAIVTGAASGKTERYEVSPGDELPGFAVKDVREDGVLVVADDREFTIPLYAGGPKAAAGTARTEAAPVRPAQPGAPQAGSVPPAPAGQPVAVPGRIQPPAAAPPVAQPPGPTAPGGPYPSGGERRRPTYIPGRR